MEPTTISLSLPPEQLTLLQKAVEIGQQQLALAERQFELLNGSVFLKEQEAADRLRVALSTFRKWKEQGHFRVFADGPIVRYRADYLDSDYERKFMVKARNK